MSRCFPFPPPGYEKKPIPEQDLLKEEKHKEKKHKKDKKDKEKREGKDRKERDKSDGKHKEKKDKKEKHRDKKEKNRDKRKDKEKEKDKWKDKEKSSISEDASVTGRPATENEEKLHTQEGHPKDKSRSSDEKKFASPFQGQNGQNSTGNKLLSMEIEESKFVQELGRRIRDEGKAVGSKTVERASGAECRENQGTYRFPVRDPQNLAEDKEKNRERRVDDRKVEGKGLRDESQISGNTVVQNLAGSTKRKVEGMPLPVQKDTERIIEGKNKSKEKGNEKRGEKHKDKEKKDKKSHGKDKGREKDKKEEKTKERSEHKKNERDRAKELYRTEFIGISNTHSSHLPTDDQKHFTPGENLKKRKDLETNGFLHEHEVRPNKLSRSTSHQMPQNGRILEACQTPSLLASEKQRVASKDKSDHKERLVNGSIEAPSPHDSNHKPSSPAKRSDQPMEVSTKTLQADQVVEAPRKLTQAYQVAEASKRDRQADQIVEPSKKPPHPDLKYLSQVLSVPKVEEWSEVDDQEWLFSSKGLPSKKPDVASGGSYTEPQVWSEALHIESADIYALPYVIPY